MRPSLALNLRQQLTLTPQLQQAIRLLQLSTGQLIEEIQQILEKNPLLELEEYLADQESVSEENQPQSISHSNEDYSTLMWSDSQHGKQRNHSAESNETSLEDMAHASESLQDHLLWQAQLTPFSAIEQIIASTIIDSINDDGYLIDTLDDLQLSLEAQGITVNLSAIEKVLQQIQRFDPVGIGARNIAECLIIQLDESASSPYQEIAKQIIKNDLILLGQHQYQKIMQKYALTASAWQPIQQLILSLQPKPGARITAHKPQYIIPDLIATKSQQQWQVQLNSTALPQIKLNTHYKTMLRGTRSAADRVTLRQYLQEARWLMNSIQHRQNTLVTVANCIVEQQQNFFNKGISAITPLTMEEIADLTTLHLSTISRVTTQKYVRTPHGIFELKYFFSSRLATEKGEACSSKMVRAMIKKMVMAEPSHKPLSDETLSQLLAQQGINVARRTVTKYREAMAIPSSQQRKTFSSTKKGAHHAN